MNFFLLRIKQQIRDFDDNDEDAASVSDAIPSTPTGQTGTFEATIPPIPININIPLSEYNWNQVSELQLPDGRTVCSFVFVCF